MYEGTGRATVRMPRPERYAGHDRFVGLDPGTVKLAVTRWLWATGRYQRYLWPLIAGEPEMLKLAGVVPAARATLLREAAGAIMSAMTADLPALSERVFAELDYLEEADAEIMRWYAVHRMAEYAAAAGIGPAASIRIHIRNEVAVCHGFRQWNSLVDRVENNLLWNAIPFDWIDEACERWATARTYSIRQVIHR
jgi:hypothetical protein